MTDLFSKFKRFIGGGNAARGRILVPQQLIDDVFPTDEEAEAWFKSQGFILKTGRLKGLPTVAALFRIGIAQPHYRKKPAKLDIDKRLG